MARPVNVLGAALIHKLNEPSIYVMGRCSSREIIRAIAARMDTVNVFQLRVERSLNAYAQIRYPRT